jgi:hypothetical protein
MCSKIACEFAEEAELTGVCVITKNEEILNVLHILSSAQGSAFESDLIRIKCTI